MLVYRLISPSGKSYIGLTSRTFDERFKQHISDFKRNKFKTKLYNAFHTYPPKTWTYEILTTTEDKEEAKQKEISFIQQFNTINDGYNLSQGGDLGRLGMPHTDETKQLISLQNLGRKHTKEQNEQHSKLLTGRKLSEATRRKIGESHRGKKRPPRTEEWKRKISMSRIGRKFGPLSEEHKLKLRISHLGKRRTTEQIEKHRQAMLGKKASIETRLKLSAAHKGKKRLPITDKWRLNLRKSHIGIHHSDEHKRKISDSLKNYYNLRVEKSVIKE